MHELGFLLAAASIFATACAEDPPPSSSRLNGYKPFDLMTRQAYSDYKEVVGSYLLRQSKNADTHACVIGLTQGQPNSDVVWVVWRDGDRLIKWFSGENDLELSSRNLSLTDDVVSTDADIGTSTYLVSRSWVIELERLCEAHGRRVAATL